MPSKRVLNHQRSALAVAAAIDTHGPDVMRALAALLAPTLAPGESLPDLGLALSLLKRLTLRRLDALADADQHLDFERVEDRAARAARDQHSQALSDALSDLSEVVSFAFGDDARALLHLDGPSPRDPITLIARAQRAADALSQPALPLPPPKRAGVPFDPSAHAQTLRALLADLSHAVTAVSADARETEQALLSRDAAEAAFHRAFLASANIFEHACRLTDAPDLAERLRRSSSRPSAAADTPSTLQS